MKTLKSKQKRPFTIVEMMVALILFSVIMAVLLSLMTQSQNIVQRGISKANVYEDATMVLNRMADDFICADFSLETDPAYLDEGGYIQYSTIVTEQDKCTILTRRYDNGTSVLCKVVYELNKNDCTLKETVYNYRTSDFNTAPASRETLLNNVIEFNVIAGNKTFEDQDEASTQVDPNEAKAFFDTADGDGFHPFYVTIRLVLMDEETRKIGIKQADANNPNYSPSASDIRSKIGADKLDARLRVLTRTVSLNLNPL